MLALRVVAGVTNHFMIRLPEWVNAVTLMLFGTTLLRSGNTFDNPAFMVMKSYAGEETWGCTIVAIASLRLAALMLNGTFPRLAAWSLRVRAMSATLCCLPWFVIALGLYTADQGSTGARTYAVHFVTDMIMAIYLGGEAGKLDRGRWNGRT